LKYLRIFSVSKPNETHCPEFGHILSRDVRILSDKGLLKNGQILSCFSLINGAMRPFSASSLAGAGSSLAASIMGAGKSPSGDWFVVDNSRFGNSLTGDDSLFGDKLIGEDSLFGDKLIDEDSLFGDKLKNDDSLFGEAVEDGTSLFGITPPIRRETDRGPLLDDFKFFLVKNLEDGRGFKLFDVYPRR